MTKKLFQPPIVKRAEMNNRIPIDTYKSKSNESLMNSAPLNKSALKIKFFHNKLK
jgi:hypothetical protein